MTLELLWKVTVWHSEKHGVHMCTHSHTHTHTHTHTRAYTYLSNFLRKLHPHLSHLTACFNVVIYYRKSSHWEERFWQLQRQRSEPSACKGKTNLSVCSSCHTIVYLMHQNRTQYQIMQKQSDNHIQLSTLF